MSRWPTSRPCSGSDPADRLVPDLLVDFLQQPAPPASMLRMLAAISVTSCATVGRRATCGITVTFGCSHSGLSGGSGSGFSASSAA